MDEFNLNETNHTFPDENSRGTNFVVGWIIIDGIIIFLTLAGNILTILAIILSKKISDLLSNRYIFSLAISDLMVGMSIPYHLAFTIGFGLEDVKTTCVLRFVLITLACSSSIYNLLAIATDRFIAIVLPFHYSRHMCRKIVCTIIFGGWLLSLTIASMPIYWNDWKPGVECDIVPILPDDYVNFVITPMFASIWLAMFILYIKIWKEAKDHANRLRSSIHPQQIHTKILKEHKSVQMVMLILGCFTICWLPYFVIITAMRFYKGFKSGIVYEIAFTLAVTNSCMNPFIYAWKSRNYRKAFGCMLRCKSPSILNQDINYITDHVPSSRKRPSFDSLNEHGVKSIELNLNQKYDEHENSDVTISTCMDVCSIHKFNRSH